MSGCVGGSSGGDTVRLVLVLMWAHPASSACANQHATHAPSPQELCGSAKQRVPLHARYPRPRLPPAGGSLTTAAAWLHSPAVEVQLPPLAALLHCNGTWLDSARQGWVAVQVQVHGDARWSLPAGNVRQGPAVAAVTAAAVLGGAAAVLAALWRHGSGETRQRPARSAD